MADTTLPIKAEGDEEALLWVLALILGGAAWLIVASIIKDHLLAEVLGFFTMCAVQFPFALRTWAAGVPARRYWESSVAGAAVLAALRLISQ
jgi:hypothetical protein